MKKLPEDPYVDVVLASLFAVEADAEELDLCTMWLQRALIAILDGGLGTVVAAFETHRKVNTWPEMKTNCVVLFDSERGKLMCKPQYKFLS